MNPIYKDIDPILKIFFITASFIRNDTLIDFILYTQFFFTSLQKQMKSLGIKEISSEIQDQ